MKSLPRRACLAFLVLGLGTMPAPGVAQGTRTLFETDFSGEKVGAFPQSLRSTAPGADANEAAAAGLRDLMEMAATVGSVFGPGPPEPTLVVASWKGGRWVTVPAGRSGSFHLPLPGQMPERFTLEFDSSVGAGRVDFTILDQVQRTTTPVQFRWTEWADAPTPGEGWLEVDMAGPFGGALSGTPVKLRRGDVFRGRITVDGQQVSAAINGTPVAKFHTSTVRRASEIVGGISSDGDPLYVTSIRLVSDQ